MSQIEVLLKHTLTVYIIETCILIGIIIIGIRYVLHNKQNSQAMGVLVCILSILLCVILTRNIVPFALDYFGNDLCEVYGVYENKVGGDSTSGSSGLGFYAVRITINEKNTLDLTTVPLAQDYFPVGTYSVKAYYTQRSRMLVYIEILDSTA